MFLENAITSRNAFDLRTSEKVRKKIMTIEREDMRIAYRDFIEVVEMTTEKLLNSNLKIYTPFKHLGERISSDDLAKTSLPLSHRVGFISWCEHYTENVLNELQKVAGDTKVVERDDYWEVFIPSSIASVEQDEIFNTIAHRCGSPMWKGVHFGDVSSPLKFDDFITNFEQDGWDALHGQLGRYTFRIWDDTYHKIDGVQQVCDRLDSLGRSEQTYEDCRNRVFGL